MVSGTKWPEGDPFLTKQNEPSIAVSSRNSRHLLAGSNDYRLVPVEVAEALDDPEAWLTVYKSIDGGASWRGQPLGGCPINIPECNDSTGLTAPLKALKPNFGADPTVRPGPYGTFFYSFIAGTRDTSANGVVAVQRFVDKNNDVQRATDVRGVAADGRPMVRPAEDPILPDALTIVTTGTPGQGKDKPWVAADVGGRTWNAGKTCELLSWTKNRTDVTNAAETVPAFNVYVTFASFQGNSNNPDIYAAVSSDCGKTFAKPIKLTSGTTKNQGTSSAIDPLTGAVYVVWRAFAVPGSVPPVPDAVMLSKSTDGGATWNTGKVPTKVATINPYDQGATGVSFRTLGFPTVAVSVKNGISRVHVAWAQRKVAPSTTAPYGCPSTNPADCDARIVIATSGDGGVTWPAAIPVDPNVADPSNPANPGGRGHQVQPSLTFAAGKLLALWLDQRQDHTEGVLQCPTGQTCTNTSQLVEVRRAAKNSNLDPNCKFPSGVQSPLSPGASCYQPNAVWTTYLTDGTPYLVRRHTLDAFAAMADPADAPVFASSRVSQYTFGSTVAGAIDPQTGNLTPQKGTYEIVQKELNPPNLPMFSNGRSAFIGDYIDAAGQIIVATGDPARPYKFNVGGGASGNFVTSGFAPAFQVAFTDNRDVIPPLNGNWTTPTCLTSAFTKDAQGNITGVNTAAGCGSPGYAGNRNQNVYTAAVVENSAAFANSNSKRLDGTTPRGFVVTVRNHSNQGRTYTLTLPAQAAGVTASFDKLKFPSGLPNTPLTVFVQPRSSSARTVWATSTTPNAKIVVQIASTDGNYTTQLVLNADPTAPLVTNGDAGPATSDTAIDSLGNVVLSNAVLTNNVLSNNALTNNVLSNNALTNAVLSNVVLSNAVLSNLDPVNAALSNNVLTNNALSNVVLSNAVLSNNALSNVVLSNVVLSNNALNAALTNLDPTNVALSNAVLSNNALTNVALSNNALSNVMLTNNVLSNAVLSNVALSNAALSNNALSNNPLAYVALSNAPLGGDVSTGGDPDALRGIETASAEIVSNGFQTADLSTNSFSFKETSFTIRNRGNTDTTLAIKLMLRDASCNAAHVCTPPVDAQGNLLYKLQLVLRKVALVPVAIPPTGPALSTGRAIRIGIAQSNTEVSNVSDLPLIDPNDPTLGKFLPDDPKAATLSLSAGEYAYATIRAIGLGGNAAPDPAELLRWGVKPVAANANSVNGPLVIRTFGFPSAFVARTPATPTFQTFGGVAPIAGDPGALTPEDAPAVCTDKDGNPVLNGVGGPPSNGLGSIGNFYIDTAAQTLYGQKTASGWPATGTPLIVNGPSGPQASVPCPPGAIDVGAFTTDASFNSTATISFTPKYWGDFFMRVKVKDASAPAQTDRQVIKVTVLPRPPVLTYSGFLNAVAPQLTYNNNGLGINLRQLVSSDSINGAGVPQPIVFNATGSCHMAADGNNLVVDRATVPITGPADCIVTVHEDGNEIYAPVTDTKAIFIDRASQTISFTVLPVNNQLTYGAPPTTVVAAASSPTAPPSNLPVTFTSTTTSICATSGTSGVVTIVGAGTCQLQADQGGNANYKPAPTLLPPSFIIKKAPTITAVTVVDATYDGNPHGGAASVTGPVGLNQSLTVTYTGTGATTYGPSTTAPTNAGTYSASATYAATANYLGSSDTKAFTINKAPTTTAVSVSDATYDGSPHGGTAVVTGPASLNQPLTVSYTGTGATSYGPSTTAPTNAGTYSASATYAETANYLSSSDAKPFTINKAPTTTALVTSLTPAPTGSSVTFTATLSPSPATGTVQFLDGTTSLGSPSIVTGQASVATSSLTVGTHTITAVYSGDSNYLGSTSPSVTQVIDTPPVVLADAYGVLKDTALNVGAPGVLGNDGDVDPGQTLATVLPVISPPAHATSFQLNPDGSFSYTPTPGFMGVDTFSYQATDGQIAGDTRTVTVTVLDPTATPVAENDAYSVAAGPGSPLLTVVAPGVLGNDNGQGLTALLEVGGEPAHGSVTLNPDGSFTYTPDNGYTGLDRFLYRAQDGSSHQSNLAMVTIAVLAAGAAPVAVNDSYTADQETPLTTVLPGVLANDTTATGAARVSGPLYGTLVFPGDGSFVYTPIAGFSGMDSFTYRATNGAASSNLAMATILVRAKTTTTIAAPTVSYPADGVVTVTVSASSGTPAGTVSLTVDGGTPVPQTVDGTGQSIFTFTGISGGSHALNASYSAQGSFGASSAVGTLQVNQAATITTVTVGDATYDGNTHGGTASVTGPGSLSQSLPVTYAGTGGTTYASTATAPTSAGTYSASANYSGSTNYLGSTDTKPFTINQAPTTTVVTVVDATYDGNPHGGTANVTGVAGLNQPLTVTYTGTGATTYGPITTAPTNAGTYSASATYAALANYLGSSDAKAFAINKAPTTTVVTVADAIYDGGSHGGTASVTGPASLNQSLAVSYAGTGATTYGPSTTAPTNVGAYSASASYAETANYLGSSDTKPFTIEEGFSAAASMNLARAGHTSTLLADGTVLVTGGVFDGTGMPTTSAEVYCSAISAVCPAADGSFKPALGSMGTPRFGHTATLLTDGTVLVAGGVVDPTDTPTASTEVYCTSVSGSLCTSPSDVGKFKPATAMSAPRAAHTATLLSNGTVLVAGGTDFVSPNPPLNTSEVYCSAAGGPCATADGTFQPSGSMGTPRDSHTATLLGDGTVLVAGGEIDDMGTSTNTAEVYCAAIGGPCTAADGSFKPTTNLMSSVRSVHTASLLQDGRVLVVGGYGPANATASVDVYCAVAAGNCGAGDLGTFKPVGPLVTGRANQTSTLLTDGWVLAAGGLDAASLVLATSELFDPVANVFATGASMASPRSGHAATRLQDGRVLITGGENGLPVKSAEIYISSP